MDILLYKDIILNFIAKTFSSKAYEIQVKQIFENEGSSFVYSKKYFEFIQKEVQPEDEQFFFDLVRKISDSGNNIVSSTNPSNYDEEFLHINASHQNQVKVKITYTLPAKALISQIPNIAVLTEQKKPNYHWLAINIAIAQPNTLTLRNFDFCTNEDVDRFFYDLWSIPDAVRGVTIFDDNCNFQHNKFKLLKEKKIRVFYHTSRLPHTENCNRFKEMGHIFSSYQMFIKQKGCHEREIIFEGFIINPTHDFWNLEVGTSAPKWSIHIQYNPAEARKASYYRMQYDRFYL
jgi:hypothetical protein